MRKSKTIRVLLTVFLCCFVFGVFALAASAGAPETHTVSFWLGEGVPYEGETQVIQDGGHAVIPKTPEKENAVFLRWTLHDGGRFSFRSPVTEDVALYAEWDELEEGTTLTQIYTVEFTVGGETVSRQSIEKGQDAIAPTGFDCPEGKTFVAWDGDYTNVQDDLKIAATLTDTVYTVKIFGVDDEYLGEQKVVHGGNADLSSYVAPAHYSLDGKNPYDGVAESITSDGEIYIHFVPDLYTVRFYSDGAAFGAEQKVGYGSPAAFPEIPAKENYIFIGWYLSLSDSTMFDFNLPIEDDVDLYAKFIPIENKKYTVTFRNYDGTRYGGAQLIEEGKTAFVPGTPAREGYAFIGWCDEEGDEFDFSTPIESDRIITARFRIRSFTVTVTDGDEILSVQSVKYGENAQEPEIPEKEGVIFAGFDGSFNDIRQDTVIRVRYLTKTFSVMFFDGQQKKIGGTQYVEYGKSATAPSVSTPDGYAFLGWSDDFENVTDDLVLFPVFERLSFTVRFFDGDEQIGSETVLFGEGVVGISVERDGWLFTGWLSDGVPFDMSAPVKGDLDLSASWQEKPPVVHTVTFTVNGETYLTQTVADGAAAQTPANPTKVGYTFLGWDADFDAVTEDITVNAKFEINTYVVTFTVNGAVFHTEEIAYGLTATAPAETPEREGYRFVRWNCDFETPITEDMTVKAVFAVKTYTVRFLVGDETVSEQIVEHDDFAAVPATPQSSGKTFAGWYLTTGAKFRFSTPVTEDLTVVAHFDALSFRVDFMLDGEVFDTRYAEYGETVAAPAKDPYKEGYRFVGWDFDFATPITGDTTVYPVFREIFYTVTFFTDGKEWASETVARGAYVSAPASPRKDGYRFVGWDYDFREPVNADATVNALFEKLVYTVTFYVNGSFRQAEEVAWGGYATEPEAVEIEGYRFVGWDFDFTQPITADTTVAAVYEEIIVEPTYYTVTFVVDGKVLCTETVEEGKTATVPDAPSREGYRFIGWSGDVNAPILGDATFVAVYEKIIVEPTYYTVTFTVDGAVFHTQRVKSGDNAAIPEAPEKEGYVFVRWDFDFNTPIYADTTVAAVYRKTAVEPTLYTVTFKADGEVFCEKTVEEGCRVAEPYGIPQKSGYYFVRWDFDFSTPIYADVTIEAVFEEYLSETYNLFELMRTENEDGTKTLTLSVRGDTVSVAGFIGAVRFKDGGGYNVIAYTLTDAEQTDVNFKWDEIRFIWSGGENATAGWTVFSVTLDAATDVSSVVLTMDEVLKIDFDGNVRPAPYAAVLAE